MSQSSPDPSTVHVDMQPIGRRTEIEVGATLLQAAQTAGVGLVSLCAGEGWCEGCLIRLVDGELSPSTAAERDVLSEEEIATGYRLACQSIPRSNVKIDIPPESLTTPQRLQVEGQDLQVALEPPVQPIDLHLDPPNLHDLRADTGRLGDALAELGYPATAFKLPLLADLSDQLRDHDWSVRLAVRCGEAIAVLPPQSRMLGLAVDIGTTKLAVYLMDIVSGATVAQVGAMNPQIAYGEDVLSRIAYSNHHDRGRQLLQEKVVATLNNVLSELCGAHAASVEQIVEAVVVGNTAMHHLFAGLPVRQLALTPYVPAVSDALDLRARDIGLNLAPGAYVHLLPNIAGYVGADHVAVILATGLWRTQRTAIAVDIGTNTEITLAANGQLLSCSCASGPAFEGAHIRDGMRAAAGAIERMQIVGGEVRSYTIGNQAPVGICGSGILDTVAEMRAAGILDEKGALRTDDVRVRATGQLPEFLLVPATHSGHGRDITVNRKDVNEIQLAKAAIRVGIEILLAEAGIESGAVEEFIVAGAFGTYIDISSAIRVGMFPDLPLGRFRQVGNAAGMGAKQTLISNGQRQTASEIAQRVKYVELTTHPLFQKEFLKAMYL